MQQSTIHCERATKCKCGLGITLMRTSGAGKKPKPDGCLATPLKIQRQPNYSSFYRVLVGRPAELLVVAAKQV
nr:unnamed protein product [Callosobruchus analis]